MEKIPTAEEFMNLYHGSTNKHALIEFAKLHIENVKALMEAKYYAGETGYIIKEEWRELLDNIR